MIHIISASSNALWLKDLPAIVLARIFGKKAVLNFVGGMAVDTARKWGWWKRLPFCLANTVVVPTSIFKKVLNDTGISSDVVVIPHTVGVESFKADGKATTNGPPVLLAAKALESYAGFDLLLDVFEKVKKKVREAELWIAGTGPAEGDLKLRVGQMKTEGIKFLGNVCHDDMARIMAESRVFVHGTQYESFGIVLVEAMASGLPVVAFKIGGIPEVVLDDRTGCLVDYGDTDAFADRIVNLLGDHHKYSEMSRHGVRHSASFDWRNISRKWYDLFDVLLGNRRQKLPERKPGVPELEVETAHIDDIRAIDVCRRIVFPDSIVTSLSRRFSEKVLMMFTGVEDNFLFVVREDQQCVGYCAGTLDTIQTTGLGSTSSMVQYAFWEAVLCLATRPWLLFDRRIGGQWRFMVRKISERTRKLFRGNYYEVDSQSTEMETAWIVDIGVHPDYRGRGIGSKLLFQFDEHVKTLGLFKAGLSVEKANTAAIRVYEKHGWEVAKTHDTSYYMTKDYGRREEKPELQASTQAC